MQRPHLAVAVAISMLGCIENMTGSDTGAGQRPGKTDALADASAGRELVWETLAPMPLPRTGPCPGIVGDQLFLVGGQPAREISYTDAIHAAPIGGDGELGAWREAGSAIAPIASCTATVAGDSLYIAGGYAAWDPGERGVWRGTLDASGDLGAWERLGPLQPGYLGEDQMAWWVGDRLHVTDVRFADPDGTVILRAELAGSSTRWAEDSWLDQVRYRALFAHRADHVYAIGGFEFYSGEITPRVDRVTIAKSGNIESVSEQSPLPGPLWWGRAIAVDDRLFVLSGLDQASPAPPTQAVWSARIESDGSLAEWTAQTPLPSGRLSPAIAVIGDWLYVLGGAGWSSDDTFEPTDTVFRARVRPSETERQASTPSSR